MFLNIVWKTITLLLFTKNIYVTLIFYYYYPYYFECFHTFSLMIGYFKPNKLNLTQQKITF